MTLDQFRARLLAQMVPACSPCVTLTAEQEAEVRRLRDEKYRSWEWTWGRTPAFTYEKEGTFAGVPFHGAYQARKGIVSGVVLSCAALDGGEAARLLCGAQLDPEVFEDACRTLAPGRAEELLDLLL